MNDAEVAHHRPGRRIRIRLLLGVVGLVAAVSLVLSSLAFVLVSRSLRADALDRAIEEARFNVAVLAAERLDPPVEPGDIEASGLADDLQRRNLAVYADLGDRPGDDFVSGLAAVTIPEVASPELRRVVAGGSVAAERVTIDGAHFLLVGARLAPSGPDFLFLTDVSDIEEVLAQLRLVLLGASVLFLLLGALAGWRGARLAGSLADTVDELTAARIRERRFVADVSHELRTPVTALVQEAAELADQVEVLPAPTRRVVELLHGDVRRLRDLVEELLELSRLDAGGTTAELELWDLDVPRFLAAVVAQRCPNARLDVAEGLRVRTDRRRLERIVANLLDNARVHAGGQDIGIHVRLDGQTLVLEVSDRGPGVPPEELEHIFDRFAKTDRARGGSGSGLGLAIVREHARVLRADVTAHNRAGGGLLVDVRVPVEVVAEP